MLVLNHVVSMTTVVKFCVNCPAIMNKIPQTVTNLRVPLE